MRRTVMVVIGAVLALVAVSIMLSILLGRLY